MIGGDSIGRVWFFNMAVSGPWVLTPAAAAILLLRLTWSQHATLRTSIRLRARIAYCYRDEVPEDGEDM